MKLKKLLSCLLVLLLTICMSGVSVLAAETVVFSDSFERESEPGFYVSNPVLRSYGENLFTNGDFSSDLIKSGDGVYFSVSSNYPAAIVDGELTLSPAASKVASDGGFSIMIPIDYMTSGNIYELEMYVKSASAYPFSMILNQTHLGHSTRSYYGMEYLHDNGNRLMSSVAAPEYERVVARFSIENTPTFEGSVGITEATFPSHIQLQFAVDWDFDGRTATTDALYIDNIKLRRIMNATPSTSPVQVGMPSYSDANLAGKNVHAVMDVMNSTSNAKEVTLITAYYNADTSLNSILNIYKTTVPGNSSATQRIESPEFTVPTNLNGGDIKVFAWDGTSSLVPYLEKTDSEYVGYAVKETADDHSNIGTKVAGSDVWRYEDSFAISAGSTTASFTEEIDTATANSGIASLCMPTVSGSGPSMVFTTVPVKPDTTYRLEFYAMPTNIDTFTFYVSGACGSQPNGKTYIMTGTLNSKFKWAGNLTGSTSTEDVTVTAKQTIQGARYYGPISGTATGVRGWNKVTYTFTTPPADAKAYDGVYSVAGTVGEEGSYWTTFGTNVGIVFDHGATAHKNSSTPKTREYAAWIDDVVLYEVTE